MKIRFQMSPELTLGGLLLGLAASTACKTADRNDSDTKIINGSLTNDFPAVIPLAGRCTGTIVGKRTVLTAAHCLPLSGKIHGKDVKAVIAFNNWKAEESDVALIVVEDDFAETPIRIAAETSLVAKGDEVVMVGFGCTDFGVRDRFGKKRAGVSYIDSVSENGSITVKAVVNSTPRGAETITATTCPGDSGGPMLKDGAIIGVASTSKGFESKHTSLLSKKVRDFLQQAASEGAIIAGEPLGKIDTASLLQITRPYLLKTLGKLCGRIQQRFARSQGDVLQRLADNSGSQPFDQRKLETIVIDGLRLTKQGGQQDETLVLNKYRHVLTDCIEKYVEGLPVDGRLRQIIAAKETLSGRLRVKGVDTTSFSLATPADFRTANVSALISGEFVEKPFDRLIDITDESFQVAKLTVVFKDGERIEL